MSPAQLWLWMSSPSASRPPLVVWMEGGDTARALPWPPGHPHPLPIPAPGPPALPEDGLPDGYDDAEAVPEESLGTGDTPEGVADAGEGPCALESHLGGVLAAVAGGSSSKSMGLQQEPRWALAAPTKAPASAVPKVGAVPPQQTQGTPRSSPQGTQATMMLTLAPWGHCCEDAAATPHKATGTQVRVVGLCPQGWVALAMEVTSPCPGPQHSSTTAPVSLCQQRCRDLGLVSL